jgi:phosphoribosyl-ATP pyrophosphohydrolase
MPDSDIFDRLMEQIHLRARTLPENSYTTRLIRGGPLKMGAKILEEVLETTVAAQEPGKDGRAHLVCEACDVIYHLWVLLGSQGIQLSEIRNELARREGVSGLEEKSQRNDRGSS